MSTPGKKQLTVLIDGELKDRIKADHPSKSQEPLGEFVETAIRNELARREAAELRRVREASKKSRQASEPDEHEIIPLEPSAYEHTAKGGKRNVRSTRGLGG
jgi:hypothetical protein